jgi:uncharacterized protein
VIGTALNVTALCAGASIGWLSRKTPSGPTQAAFKILLGIFTVWTGLRISWLSLNGSFWQIVGQLGLAALSLSLGHATGKLIGIQRRLNSVGRFAKHALAPDSTQPPPSHSHAFLGCAVVFVANPLGFYGALLDGIGGHWEVLAIKAVMDGLSSLAFARALGWPVLLSALPVLAFQGTTTLIAQALAQRALSTPMIESLGATGGLLVFSVSLVILELKKVELADYLPAFLYAPLLAWWLR